MTLKFKTWPRFSIRILMAAVTLFAVVFAGWIAYANHKLRKLAELRDQGAIVIVRDSTPKLLQSLGVAPLSPFTSVPTVELYIAPSGGAASVGDSDQMLPKAAAEQLILEQAATARRLGAQDVQLILIDSFDPEWVKFANQHALTSVSDARPRYVARLKANRQSGANLNP